ncbi:hypothetical protein An08g06910 [Aspergillus niger]|uniref:Uncharacterized protein n=2 Tax=Aspergillus niger TaxID=5061 RepID=A2QRR0_ASPNC|nr:hypothetical protein An08g06910 [Aspergillus niger]CAK45661.1 hypothetical protein An08g06910 [Aspergillus niger]
MIKTIGLSSVGVTKTSGVGPFAADPLRFIYYLVHGANDSPASPERIKESSNFRWSAVYPAHLIVSSSTRTAFYSDMTLSRVSASWKDERELDGRAEERIDCAGSIGRYFIMCIGWSKREANSRSPEEVQGQTKGGTGPREVHALHSTTSMNRPPQIKQSPSSRWSGCDTYATFTGQMLYSIRPTYALGDLNHGLAQGTKPVTHEEDFNAHGLEHLIHGISGFSMMAGIVVLYKEPCTSDPIWVTGRGCPIPKYKGTYHTWNAQSQLGLRKKKN